MKESRKKKKKKFLRRNKKQKLNTKQRNKAKESR